MPSKPSFHKQETSYSCVPACLRMILSGFGLDLTEEEIRKACDCTSLGTDALKAVDAMRKWTFAQSAKHTLTLDELSALVMAGSHPIVFVSMLPIDGIRETHALVVTEVREHSIVALDPLRGERTLSKTVFIAAWASRHNLAIIVEK